MPLNRYPRFTEIPAIETASSRLASSVAWPSTNNVRLDVKRQRAVSSPIPVWSGVVDAHGALHLSARDLFRGWLRRLKGRPVRITVKPATRRKSSSQLGYLFGVLYPVIADELGYRGYEVAQVHDAIMRELRGLQPDPNPLKLRVSLADMRHEQVSEYLEDVRHWAMTHYGIVTPDAKQAEAA